MNKTKLLNLSKERLTGIIYAYMIEKDNLIKYLESMLDGSVNDKFVVVKVKDILERIKSNKYE